jgi:hypothetical protein
LPVLHGCATFFCLPPGIVGPEAPTLRQAQGRLYTKNNFEFPCFWVLDVVSLMV